MTSSTRTHPSPLTTLVGVSSLLGLLLLLLPLHHHQVQASLPYPAPVYPGFQLAFEDDFNGPLNEGIWNRLDNYVQNAYVPFPGIPDLVCYKADDVWTDAGNLVIRTRARDVTCPTTGGGSKVYQYTSGWVDTLNKLTFRSAHIEVRAALPAPTFRVWPSGFTNSIYNARDSGLCWPVATEVDLKLQPTNCY